MKSIKTKYNRKTTAGRYVFLLVALCFFARGYSQTGYFRIVNGIPHLPVVASTASVSSPLAGMLVYSTYEMSPMIYSGSNWITLCSQATLVSAGNSYFTVENGISRFPIKASESISSPVTGASYYSTTGKIMTVYDGSGWTSVPDLPSSGAISIQAGTSSYNSGPFCFPVLSANPDTTGLSVGAIYINSSDNCFHVYDGAYWSALSCSFDTRWNMTAGSFTFPVYSGETYDCTIDWGDGSSSEITSSADPDLTHTYSTAGEYIIKISGTFSRIYVYDNSAVKKKLIEVINWGAIGFTSFENAFYGCSNLNSIPDEPMPGGSVVSTLRGCFSHCRLTEIPSGIFNNFTAATDFTYCFSACTGLTTIPENLFASNTAATRLFGCFNGCTGISNIPENLFANNTAVTDFTRCFASCGITTIPERLFANNTEVTTFSTTFFGSSLTSIPENLFVTNTKVTDFSSCFNNTDITNIPENIFANNTEVTDFTGCFRACGNLTGIPGNLFANNQKVTDFSECFGYSSSLSGAAPELWNRSPEPAGTRCFYSCTGLSNYSSIPTSWK